MDINGYYIGPDEEVDLKSANLAGADLGNVDLSGYDLSNASLVGANLAYANLSSTNLSNADLTGAVLTRADLHNSNVYNAKFINANLEACDLSNAFIQYVSPFDISKWNMPIWAQEWARGIGIVGITPSFDQLVEGPWYKDSFSEDKKTQGFAIGPDFSYANLAQVKLIGAILPRSRFLFASLSAANITSSQFNDSNFFGATIFGSDFSGSKLNSSVMSKVKMNGTLMCAADLTKVDFTGANLQGADLSGATITGTVFIDAELLVSKFVQMVEYISTSCRFRHDTHLLWVRNTMK